MFSCKSERGILKGWMIIGIHKIDIVFYEAGVFFIFIAVNFANMMKSHEKYLRVVERDKETVV